MRKGQGQILGLWHGTHAARFGLATQHCDAWQIGEPKPKRAIGGQRELRPTARKGAQFHLRGLARCNAHRARTGRFDKVGAQPEPLFRRIAKTDGHAAQFCPTCWRSKGGGLLGLGALIKPRRRFRALRRDRIGPWADRRRWRRSRFGRLERVRDARAASQPKGTHDQKGDKTMCHFQSLGPQPESRKSKIIERAHLRPTSGLSFPPPGPKFPR